MVSFDFAISLRKMATIELAKDLESQYHQAYERWAEVLARRLDDM
jgi:hypothetical protein